MEKGGLAGCGGLQQGGRSGVAIGGGAGGPKAAARVGGEKAQGGDCLGAGGRALVEARCCGGAPDLFGYAFGC
eukprot:1683529-Heterocapsa_arctica.AAC.1